MVSHELTRIYTSEKRVRENVGAIHELPLRKKVIKSHSRFYSNFSSLLLIGWFGLFLLIHILGISTKEVLEHLPIFCPFKVLTGIPCPGCGMTRAFLALAEFDFVRALRFNPFSLPLFAFFVFSAFNVRLPIPQRVNNYLPIVILFIILIWWFWTRFLPHSLI